MLRILYVDDDSQFRWMVSEEIKKNLGIEIELSPSGNQAIDLLKKGHRYSVIISDYSMPDGNGAELFHFLGEANIFCLFILFTSHDDTPELRSQFCRNTFLGIESKTNVRKLCSLVVQGLTSWSPHRRDSN